MAPLDIQQHMKQLHIYVLLLFMACMGSSCGFPGPIFKYNKEVEAYTQDGVIDVEKSWDYFCFGYGRKFNGQIRSSIKADSITGRVIEKNSFYTTDLYKRGGRKKTKSKTIQFDERGKKVRIVREHLQYYGRYGRERFYKEVEYLANGQKKITKRRATRHTPHKLEKIRYKGRAYKN